MFNINSLESRFKKKLRFLNLKNVALGAVKVAVLGGGVYITGFKRELMIVFSLDPERTQAMLSSGDKFASHRKRSEPLS